jgi:hypothetical protein
VKNAWIDSFGYRFAVSRPVDNGGFCRIVKEKEAGKYGISIKWPSQSGEDSSFVRASQITAEMVDKILQAFGISDSDWLDGSPSYGWQ